MAITRTVLSGSSGTALSTDLIPVFAITGFIDCGKTTAILKLLRHLQTAEPKKTLLLVCEQGEVEYDYDTLRNLDTTLKYIDDEPSFEYEYIRSLEKETSAERVLIEYNGMWDAALPKAVWDPEQVLQIMLIDTSTFDVYLSNLKSILADQLRRSDLIIFGRSESDSEKLPLYRRSARALNRNATIVFCNEDGEISFDPGEYLPYDLTDEPLTLNDDTFAAFYIDAMENPERYEDKHVKFSGIVLSTGKDERSCVIGRIVLTCCSEDLSVFGFICDLKEKMDLDREEWVDVDAVMGKEYSEKYDIWHPVCKVRHISLSRNPGKTILSVT